MKKAYAYHELSDELKEKLIEKYSRCVMNSKSHRLKEAKKRLHDQFFEIGLMIHTGQVFFSVSEGEVGSVSFVGLFDTSKRNEVSPNVWGQKDCDILREYQDELHSIVETGCSIYGKVEGSKEMNPIESKPIVDYGVVNKTTCEMVKPDVQEHERISSRLIMLFTSIGDHMYSRLMEAYGYDESIEERLRMDAEAHYETVKFNKEGSIIGTV